MPKNLNLRRLRFIAAEELKNTKGIPRNLQKSDKFELLAVAYGVDAVETDFRKWCQENRELNPRYPITEYLRVVDDRLGERAPAPKVDVNAPRVEPLRAATYDLTGILPPRKAVAELLTAYSETEIMDALKEYNTTLKDEEVKQGVKAFFSEGGCAVVIYSRQHRKDAK